MERQLVGPPRRRSTSGLDNLVAISGSGTGFAETTKLTLIGRFPKRGSTGKHAKTKYRQMPKQGMGSSRGGKKKEGGLRCPGEMNMEKNGTVPV